MARRTNVRIPSEARLKRDKALREAQAAEDLAPLGLTLRQEVRFRPRPGGGWKPGKVIGVNADGSLSIVDGLAALRAIPLDRVEARVTGPRGGKTWKALG